MAQPLSKEEFHRMQAQLLDLRTQNYQQSNDLRKNTAELNAFRQKTFTQEKDLTKALKALNKSKKAQEIDALLSENEMLHGKLHSQEEDFRLQNSTLMQELSKLCSQIEFLEQENKQFRAGHGAFPAATNPASNPVDGELLRLQDENSALQKNMAALQGRYEREVQSGRGSEVNGLRVTHTDHPDGQSHTEEEVPGQTDNQEGGEISEQIELRCTKLEQRVKEQSETELQLQTEREEKRLLREQLQTLESAMHTDSTKLQEEISKLSDRLKKKQESFLRLQTQKETLYTDSRTKIEEIQQKKEEALKSVNIRNQKLQADLQATNQVVGELKEQLQHKQKDHEVALNSLKEQIQTTKTQEMNLLRDQNMGLIAELQQHQEDKESFLAQKDDLHSQLQEATRASGRLLEQLTELEQEKEKLQKDLEEMHKIADKRKAMLDEMAIGTAQEKSRHKEEMSDVRLQHEKEVLSIRAKYERELRGLHEEKHRTEEEIRAQLREERARSRELEGLQQIVEELKLQIQSMEGTKGWFERRLREAEETIEKNLLEKQDEIRNLHEEHAARLQEKDSEIERVKQQMGEVEKERDDQVTTISNLKQEIKDTVDGQRILEKKGSSALKDLKRQLQLERKRADKLQERLQEIFTNSKTKTGLEELVLSEIRSPSHTQTGDSSSISSFSYREMMKEGTAAQSSSKSNTGSPQSQRPAELSDDEVGELFQRLAEVQQEKWMLEEKVKHLEVSCSSMADDICKKSSIIERYIMDRRRDVSPATAGTHGGHPAHPERGILGAVLRDLVKPGDENLREMNKKLQNMLEEQLTKNMHLQKDLEILSQEIVQLSKGCASTHVRDQNPDTSS
ncbi:GRIP1-associated protein 1-like isoform X1 [Acipenser ruthenus]|uniref:GRIP1-associated protein 1-like isoform X1 n=1 Tax=Acipenser ruthenus TaxID=7906 RepID=UPI002740FEB1|nr:GRIP1-associated protein 1-like isoform X1 [Acipenser ruthenus]